FLNCGNNSIRKYIWADLYAKLFLPPPIGRGYPNSNINACGSNMLLILPSMRSALVKDTGI
ncbi:MAG: hypothetical protein LWW97_10890, partial [Deltaproteobacteria bacterium]|nr:hypothetical protein [Deltaproteobacteria bacterium]